jgi:hypothetical protein
LGEVGNFVGQFGKQKKNIYTLKLTLSYLFW